MHSERHAFLYGTLASALSAAMAVFFKLASAIPTRQFVFLRMAISLVCVFPWLLRHRIQLSWSHVSRHLVRGLAGIASVYCYFYALAHLPLVNAVVLSNTSPLFLPVVVLVWLKLIVPRRRIWATLLGFAGVVLILRPTERLFDLANLAGLGCGALAAVALMGVRQLSKTETTYAIVGYYLLIATAISFVPAVVVWQPIEDPALWGCVLAVGMLAAAYQYCLTKSFTHGAATKVGVLTYLSVVFSGLAGWWVWGEMPDIWVFAGAILVIAGGVVAIRDTGEAIPWKN